MFFIILLFYGTRKWLKFNLNITLDRAISRESNIDFGEPLWTKEWLNINHTGVILAFTTPVNVHIQHIRFKPRNYTQNALAACVSTGYHAITFHAEIFIGLFTDNFAFL